MPFSEHTPFQLAPSSSPSPDTSWTLLLTGDIIPARVVNQKMTEKQDFSWPLTEIDDVLEAADLTVANLEAPLLSNCPVTNTGFTFCGDARFTKSLKEAGIDVVNLANNHTTNFGWEGIKETEVHLNENGILSTGFTMDETDLCRGDNSCSKPIIWLVKGVRVGFLGYNGVGR